MIDFGFFSLFSISIRCHTRSPSVGRLFMTGWKSTSHSHFHHLFYRRLTRSLSLYFLLFILSIFIYHYAVRADGAASAKRDDETEIPTTTATTKRGKKASREMQKRDKRSAGNRLTQRCTLNRFCRDYLLIDWYKSAEASQSISITAHGNCRHGNHGRRGRATEREKRRSWTENE